MTGWSPASRMSLRPPGSGFFRESWREFGLTCTCPDFAVPCKHIAAAFLAIVREIDADPLKVLSFQGFDLKKALKERGSRSGAGRGV